MSIHFAVLLPATAARPPMATTRAPMPAFFLGFTRPRPPMAALSDFRHVADLSGAALATWDLSVANPAPCDGAWRGVTCAGGRVTRLVLKGLGLSGVVPPDLGRLDRLLTLRLDSNRLSGGIDAIALPRLQELNVSNNLMSGRIPAAMASFPAAAFGGNAGLCSAPLSPCKDEAQQPNASMAVNASAAGYYPPASAMEASLPLAKPAGAEAAGSGKGKMGRAAVVAVVAGDFAVVGLVAGLLFCYFWPRLSGRRRSSASRGRRERRRPGST